MGMYVNTGNGRFQGAINSEIYVDKTGLLGFLNSRIGTSKRYIAVSRARRFGKSMAADMMQAYYCHTCDSSEMFAPFEIAKPDKEGENKRYLEHLNKYNVLMLDMGSFVSGNLFNKKDPLQHMNDEVCADFYREYPDIFKEPPADVFSAVKQVYFNDRDENGQNRRFIIIIDEWDCIMRENPLNSIIVQDYIRFLRIFFKSNESKDFLALAYITGILPIKKLEGESVVNDFDEYTMTYPFNLDRYFGFTEDEVKELAHRYDMDMDELKQWYDGYLMNGQHIYNPNSLVGALTHRYLKSYWTNASTYRKINTLIEMDYEGLKEDAHRLMAREKVCVDVDSFENDLNDISSRDDCLTALIHLGYLAYNDKERKAYIPNYEVGESFRIALKVGKWEDIRDALEKSDRLLESTLAGDESAVVNSIQQSRMDYSSIIAFNDENALASAIMIAYYTARRDYILVREFPSGRGFADIDFIPRKNSDKPPMIVELKWDKSAQAAIDQIKDKNYTGKLSQYSGQILLVGINYDKTTGEVSCIIERQERKCCGR